MSELITIRVTPSEREGIGAEDSIRLQSQQFIDKLKSLGHTVESGESASIEDIADISYPPSGADIVGEATTLPTKSSESFVQVDELVYETEVDADGLAENTPLSPEINIADLGSSPTLVWRAFGEAIDSSDALLGLRLQVYDNGELADWVDTGVIDGDSVDTNSGLTQGSLENELMITIPAEVEDPTKLRLVNFVVSGTLGKAKFTALILSRV